jgi:RNA polymerase sigma factor (sigma-70 family)
MSPDWTMPFSMDTLILPGMKPSMPVSANPPRANAGEKQSAPAAKAGAKKPVPASLPPSGEDDNVLRGCLNEICEQDQAALGRFYDLTVSRVYGVALRIVRNDDMAEEVVSDVYMQVWRDAHRYDDSRGRVLGWLLIIARSRALDLLRRQDEAFSHPEPYDLVSEPDNGQKSAEDLLEAAQAGSALHAAMSELTPLQRQLLSLAFFRGLSHSEIVEHCGMPLGSVKTHIRRALGVLREVLGDDVATIAAGSTRRKS